ncbi:MAG TPA: hypothetical protein VGG48_19950 [Rhizomicrobium sp.]
MSGRGEILVEFVVNGNFVKVSALDPVTGVEAVVIGPASAPRATMTAAVMRKLDYMLKKKKGGE